MAHRKPLFSTSIALFGLLGFASLQAATITPNITTDPAIGADANNCSLRYAVQAINQGDFTNVAGCQAVSVGTLGTSDEIVLGATTYVLTEDGSDEDGNATGDLDVSVDFILSGSGSGATIIDASGLASGDRILDINDINSGRVEGLTLTGGDASQTGNGGAIQSIASLLELEDVHVFDNSADLGGGITIEGSGSLLMNNSTVESNDDQECGGGLTIITDGVIGVSNSTFNDNETVGEGGGGICLAGFNLFLANSTISGNRSAGDGGGIFVFFEGSQSGLKGAYNVTIAFNEATGAGGGIAGVNSVPTPTPTAFPTRIFNSIIALNTAARGNDCAQGNFRSGGHNLIGELDPNALCGDFVDGVNGDQVGAPGAAIDPLIGPLADNGGPTKTHALLVGSPAIDKANPNGCEALDVANFIATNGSVFNELTTDQRGEPRPVAVLDPAVPVCDIGAYEFQVVVPTPSPTPIPTLNPNPFFEGSGCSLGGGTASAPGFAAFGLIALLASRALRRRRS